MLCRSNLQYRFFLLNVGKVLFFFFCCTIKAIKSYPALPRTPGSSITSYTSAASILLDSACCFFFLTTLSMYRETSISGTTFSGKKRLSGKVIYAFFVPLIEVLLYLV
jgi:hypothetical protein